MLLTSIFCKTLSRSKMKDFQVTNGFVFRILHKILSRTSVHLFFQTSFRPLGMGSNVNTINLIVQTIYNYLIPSHISPWEDKIPNRELTLSWGRLTLFRGRLTLSTLRNNIELSYLIDKPINDVSKFWVDIMIIKLISNKLQAFMSCYLK